MVERERLKNILVPVLTQLLLTLISVFAQQQELTFEDADLCVS